MLAHLLLRLPPAQALARGLGSLPVASLLPLPLGYSISHTRQVCARSLAKSSPFLSSPGAGKPICKWNFLREDPLPPPPEPGFGPPGWPSRSGEG